MALECSTKYPLPSVSGSVQLNYIEDDLIEDAEVEQASRNIASIDSKLASFEVFIESLFTVVTKFEQFIILFCHRIRICH